MIKKLLSTSLFISMVLFSYGQCGDIIYASTSGSFSGAGTMASPKTIQAAFAYANPGDKIRLATGTYSITSTLVIAEDNLIIEGGFLQATGWQKTSEVGATTIFRPK